MTTSMPSQKLGIARNTTAMKLADESDLEFGRSALIIPAGSPINHETRIEIRPISALIAPRLTICSVIDSFRKKEEPRSPLRIPPSHEPY